MIITFCGLDGSGKTTQIKRLEKHIKQNGKSVCLVKQPTDWVRSSDIFRTYMDMDCEEYARYDYRALSLLCAADRVQHCSKVILPLVKKGCTVISDRYYYCCLANLLARKYTNEQWIYDVSRYIPKPDISFFLDVDVETAVKRIRSRADEKNRYIDVDFMHRLRGIYLDIAKANDAVIIGADMDINECSEIIKQNLRRVTDNV